MKNNKYKILVLSDLKKSTSATLKTAVSLAKMIDGEIEFFHVKKPIDIVEKENQLSAIRTINENHTLIRKKIEKLLRKMYFLNPDLSEYAGKRHGCYDNEFKHFPVV